MKRRILCFVLLALCTPTFAADARKPYHPPRLSDGHVDMQGRWKNSDLTPLERPAGTATLTLSADDAAREKTVYMAPSTTQGIPDDPGKLLEERSFEPIRGRLRSSLITDPPDGRIPWNDAYRDRPAAIRKAAQSVFDNPEQRPAIERCLSSNGAPPMIPNNDSNIYQIMQIQGISVVVSEFVHDVRIIRMDSTHSPAAVTSWLGDSIGWWEGDTLVVESTYFAPNSSIRMNARALFLVSPETTVIERFTRISADELNYVFTVTDPTYYLRPWSGEGHLLRTESRLFEMACHEGNYSLENILGGARQQETSNPRRE